MLIDFLFAVSHRVWSLYMRLDCAAYHAWYAHKFTRYDILNRLAGIILRIDSRVLTALENRLDSEVV